MVALTAMQYQNNRVSPTNIFLLIMLINFNQQNHLKFHEIFAIFLSLKNAYWNLLVAIFFKDSNHPTNTALSSIVYFKSLIVRLKQNPKF